MARRFAEANAIDFESYPTDWNRYGKAAGPIRNQQMLDEGKPDIVVAFSDTLVKPNGKPTGTGDMVIRAKKADLPVILISRP